MMKDRNPNKVSMEEQIEEEEHPLEGYRFSVNGNTRGRAGLRKPWVETISGRIEGQQDPAASDQEV